MRHSFSSNLVRKGISIYIVQQLLGHSDISITQIYAHLRNESLNETIKMLNWKFKIYSHLRAEDLKESVNKLNN